MDLYTKIVSASVYRGGAQVTRKGSAQLEAGTQTLYVHGLSQNAPVDTARLFCQEGLSCSDLRFVDRFGGEEDPKVTELREKIAALEKHVEVRQLQVQLWKDNGNFSSRTEQPAAEVQDYIEKLAERLETLNKDILDTKKKINDLNKQIGELTQNGQQPVLAAQVTAEQAGRYNFELRYFENGAWWRPVYEIHSDGESPLAMRMRANIRQNTYEDWEGIELSLLTGSPNSAGTVPVLKPLYLDIRQPIQTRARANGMMGGAKMKMAGASAMMDTMVFEEAAEPTGAPMMFMATAEAQVEQSETATEYKLPGARDVQKGGEGTVADIQVYTIPAEYRVASVPRLEQSAYLVAAVKPADLPITSAVETAVYYKNNYIGRITLDPDLTKDEAEITLGKSERVFAAFKEVSRKTSTTLLKGLAVVDYVYEITVRNESGRDITLAVKDQIPVSENKDITVEQLEVTGAEKDEETGILTWRTQLEAGKTATYTTRYKVSRPKDKQINEIRR